MQEILIEKIQTNKSVQSRVAINNEYVAELAEQIKAGKRLPPVDVYKSGDDMWISDGFHRLRANESAGKRTIRANIHKGTEQDAAWASCAANQDHGLRRTNADKRNAVEQALKLHPEKSDQVIAEHVGVHVDTVRAQRRQVVGNHTPERVGKDGKTYRVPPPPPPPPQGLTKETTTRKTPPPPPPAPRAEENPADLIGQPIPENLQELFERGYEVDELLTMLSELRSALKQAQESGDVLFADCNFQRAEAGISEAYNAIKATKPYAVCPWCHGVLSDKCRGCQHRGVLGEHRYSTTVPRELKK